MKHTSIRDMNLIRSIERINATVAKMEELEQAITTTTEPSDKAGFNFIVTRLGDAEIRREYVEDTDFVMPTGDYLNPIRWVEGMTVEQGKFYWYEDKDLPLEALKSGTPTKWADEYFEQF